MYQFIETICYEKGQFQRLELHNERCNKTRSHFFGTQPALKLELHLQLPLHLIDRKVKCTVTYGIDIISIEYVSYEIKPVKSLQLVTDNAIDYAFKFADRTPLSLLSKYKGQSDDILIIKNGLITDTSYANAVYLNNNTWYSQKKPLLLGTRLQYYLNEKRVTPTLLTPDDLSYFSEVRIINAMISIEDSPIIPIESIHF